MTELYIETERGKAMSYKAQTIIETIKGINQTYYLPSIQRKFVWDVDQIENLFDSLMQGYPIGTFLFWSVEKGGDPSHIDEYTFYEFINNYDEKNTLEFMQTKVEKPSVKERIVAVLDGQQRLSSLYCALRGSYAYKTGKKISPNDPYPKRELYLNLLYHSEKENDNKYGFKFITAPEAVQRDQDNYWLKVKDVIGWSSSPNGRNIVKHKAKGIIREIQNSGLVDLTTDQYDEIESCIEVLWERIVTEPLITYFDIEKEALDDILDIFVRVNSAGTPLSKSDLVFSTIVANWEDGREKIEALLENLNSKGERFKFDKDFVITMCLALMDLPQKFKVDIFTKDNVAKVSCAWDEITSAIDDSVELLVDFGFCHDNFTAYYIIIPVTYYLFKSGKRVNQLTDSDRETIRKFLITGMIKKIFSASVEGVLASMLSRLKQTNINGEIELRCKDHFDFDALKHIEFQEKTLKMEETDIDDVLNLKKGSLTFMVLSLLYPELKLGEIKWHQDHIHPQYGFEKKRLIKYFAERGMLIDDATAKEWARKANTLVNLQLLTGKQNQEKSKTPLVKWLSDKYPENDKLQKYCDEHFIDTDIGFELENFDTYYARRKANMKKQLMKIFNVPVISVEETRVLEEQRSEEESIINPEGKTIAEAALSVVMNHPEGLTCKQIYDEIIANNLYEFKAENPEGVLRIEIRRRCQNVEISKSYEIKWFRIVKEEAGETYYGITFSD